MPIDYVWDKIVPHVFLPVWCVCLSTAACRLPVDARPCTGQPKIWVFHSNSGLCLDNKKDYCQVNSNKFYSKRECEEYCGVMKDPGKRHTHIVCCNKVVSLGLGQHCHVILISLGITWSSCTDLWNYIFPTYFLWPQKLHYLSGFSLLIWCECAFVLQEKGSSSKQTKGDENTEHTAQIRSICWSTVIHYRYHTLP